MEDANKGHVRARDDDKSAYIKVSSFTHKINTKSPDRCHQTQESYHPITSSSETNITRTSYLHGTRCDIPLHAATTQAACIASETTRE